MNEAITCDPNCRYFSRYVRPVGDGDLVRGVAAAAICKSRQEPIKQIVQEIEPEPYSSPQSVTERKVEKELQQKLDIEVAALDCLAPQAKSI